MVKLYELCQMYPPMESLSHKETEYLCHPRNFYHVLFQSVLQVLATNNLCCIIIDQIYFFSGDLVFGFFSVCCLSFSQNVFEIDPCFTLCQQLNFFLLVSYYMDILQFINLYKIRYIDIQIYIRWICEVFTVFDFIINKAAIHMLEQSSVLVCQGCWCTTD